MAALHQHLTQPKIKFHTHPRKIDTPRLQMQIHQKERDSTLEVSVDSRDGHLAPHIHNLDITQMRLGDGLVHLLILRDPAQEVTLRLFRVHILIIGIPRGHLEGDIGGDDLGVVACGLEEDQRHPRFLGDTFLDARAPCTSAVRSIVNTDVPALLEPLDKHFQAVVRKLLPRVIALLVRMTEPRSIVLFLDPTVIGVSLD